MKLIPFLSSKFSRTNFSSGLIAGLVFSLLFHGLAIFPLLVGFFSEPHEKPKESEPIEVVMIDRQGVEPGTLEEAHPTPKEPSSSPKAKLNLKNKSAVSSDILGGGFTRQHIANINSRSMLDDGGFDVGRPYFTDQNIEADFAADPMEKVGPAGHGWSGAVQYGNAMGLKQTLESLSYFEALHARVNSLLVYPDDFARQRVTGRVRIEAELGRDGRLIRFVSTTADDRLLQTYCFAVLIQLLQHPIPRGAWLDHERAIVAFDFDFHIRVPTEIPRVFPRGVEKNRLAFGRENEVDPWLNEKINEVFTHYVPPIIPFPGGFYVDFIAAYKFVNNLIEGTPTESQQRQARLEKLHELLRTTVRDQKPSPTPMPFPES